MFKETILLLALIIVGSAILGCSQAGNPVLPPDNHIGLNDAIPSGGRHLLDAFRVGFNLVDGTAILLPIRNADKHFYINELVKPPMCNDCVSIIGSQYYPDEDEWHLDVQLRSPSSVTVYDVRGLVFSSGDKYLENPDGLTKDFISGDVSFKAFAKDHPTRAFSYGTQYTETYIFHFPPTGDWQYADYAIDASWPTNCREPIVEDVGFPATIQIGADEATLTVSAFDHQDDFFIVLADLTPIGGGITPLHDYGQDNDGEKFDGVYGAKGIVATTGQGHHVIEIYSYDIYAKHAYNSFHVQVTGETGNTSPVIDQVTMSKTTCTMGDPSDKVTLQCVAHDDDTSDVLEYDWSATGGYLEDDTGPSAVWVPPNSVGNYYVSCEVSDGNGGFDSRNSGKLRVTSYVIQTPAPAPAYTVERLVDEGAFSLADYTPGNVVLMNYWSTLCGPCIGEFPEFMEIRDLYAGQDFALILLDIDANKNTAANWVNGHDYEVDEWGWDSGSIFNIYKEYNEGTTAIPQTFIIDNDGNVRFAKAGAINHMSEYTDIIDELI